MTHAINTDAQVRGATAKAGQSRSDFAVSGVPGLRLRVTSKGARTFRLESRKTGKVTLGTYPQTSLADARAAANILIAEAERAKVNNTTGTKVLATADKRTLSDLLDAYGKARSAAVATWGDQRRVIESRYEDYLHKSIAKLNQAAMKAPVEAERTVASKRACRYLSTVLRHQDAGRPVANSELDDLVPESAKERILSDAELRAVALAAQNLTPLWRDFTLGLIYSMKRRKDLTEAMEGHVDLYAGVWHARIHKVKGSGTKTEAHPMSTQLQEIFERRMKDGMPIFATSAGQPIRNNFDRTLKRLQKESGTSGWSWHDLRRTGRTLMGRAGVRPEIAERCMSHALAGGVSRMAGIYDLYDYGDDMRDAYQRLADKVDSIAAGSDT